ncbi:MAG: glycosyltransferase family 2 protein, partial [Actinomycetota bacterium]
MLFESHVLALDDAAEFAQETRESFSAALESSGRGSEDSSSRSDPVISVVVPFLNEMDNLSALEERLIPVLEPLGAFEVIFVDDGSTDQSAEVVLEMRQQNASIKLLRLSRNFGHQAALSAGMDHARGSCVVLMDADLQDPPELLPELLAKWREGYEVVYAVRKKRKESIPKRVAYRSFYRLLRAIAEIEIPLDAGDFCVMDRRVVEAIIGLPERTRFLRGLRTWVGFRQTAVPYDRPARRAGEAKYSARKLMKLALDGLFTLSSAPLRVATY